MKHKTHEVWFHQEGIADQWLATFRDRDLADNWADMQNYAYKAVPNAREPHDCQYFVKEEEGENR